ncbi:GGDEF domain-containing protein [Acidobacteriota bacterium]
MSKKLPLITSSLRFRLWIIIFLSSLFLMFSSLSDSFIEFLAKNGVNPGEKTTLAVGMVVILFISLFGLGLLEKAYNANKKEEDKTGEVPAPNSVQSDSGVIHQILNDKLVKLQEKLEQVHQHSHSLHGENETLVRLAAKDGLTGLYNHAYIKERLKQELYRCQRYEHPLSLLMIDIDDFKSLNDSYGHVVGDRVLKTLSLLMQEIVRPSDIIGRYGGEEFLIILPQTNSEHALAVAERIRENIEFYEFEVHPSKNKISQVTVSVGLCAYPDNGHSPEDLIAFADESLYVAKKEGKNRVTIFQATVPS